MAIVLAICACHAAAGPTPARADARGQALDRQVPGLLRDYHAAGAGVAILEHGAVVWTGYSDLARRADRALRPRSGPLGITEMALGRIQPWMTGRLATPMDAAGAYFTIANGALVSTQILALINDQPEIAAYYRQLVKKFYKVELPVLPAAAPAPGSTSR